MQKTRWQEIERIFFDAAGLPSAEREKFVIEQCGGDDELCREILALIVKDTNNSDFLDEPLFTDGLRLLENDYSDFLENEQYSRYKILRLLGRGGMGAVFLARDSSLERNVALKILPPKFAENAESVRRFRQEARAASAVSHPNIAHIYEFGEEDERFFLAMEYVEGKTLRELLRAKEINAERAVEILRQTAEAVETMHRSGIVHRDIKPENIIITDGGQVKILDFGLAKFSTEKRADSYETSMETVPGLILGTSAYMSPEQVRGAAVDERTDIWSLAVLFYEMLFGVRPFAGETASDIRASILRDEANLEGAPANLKKFFTRALQKNPDHRFQSIGEFIGEVKQIEPTSLKTNLRRILRRKKPNQTQASNLYSTAVGAIIVAFAGTIIYFLWTNYFAEKPASNKSAMTAGKRLTNSGKVKFATITKDGEWFAYSVEELGGRSIYLVRKNPQTNQFDSQPQTLLAASKNIVSQLVFSPDKQFLYFKMREPDKTFGGLYRISIKNPANAPEKILENIQGAPSFSPDGKRMAFYRLTNDNSRESVFIADTGDGANEKVLYTRSRPEFIPDTAQPAWSPDGKTILCAGGTYSDDEAESYNVFAIDAETGAATALLNDFWAEIWATAWTNGGREFVFTGHREKLADNNQLWSVEYSSGEVRRLTDDYNDYYTVTAADAKDGKLTEIVSIILQRRAQIYRADTASASATAALLTPEGDYGYGISTGSTNEIFYGSTKSGNPDIWTMNADGENQRQLTFDTKLDSQPYFVRGESEYVVFGSYRNGAESLWRMKTDGGEQTFLAANIVRDSIAVSPDGRFVYYRSNAKNAESVWRVAVAGGEPEKFADGGYKSLAVSPDGKLLAATLENEDDKPQLAVLEIENPSRKPKIFPLAEGALPLEKIRFTPDGLAVAYIAVQKGIGNLWTQALGENAPKQLTDFNKEYIYSFDFTRDGKQIFCSRGELNGYAVRLEVE